MKDIQYNPEISLPRCFESLFLPLFCCAEELQAESVFFVFPDEVVEMEEDFSSSITFSPYWHVLLKTRYFCPSSCIYFCTEYNTL